MGDFKSLAEVRQEMEEQRQKPWRPPQNAAEVNAEMSRRRRLARETQPAQEQPQETPVGFPHADAKLLSKANPVPAAAEAVAEQQPLEKAKPPSFENCTYADVARSCNISNPHVSLVMNGKRRPSVPVLRKMASFFGMSMDAIDSKLEQIRNAPAELI